MPDRYRIQLYWAPRQESLEGMARRLLDTLGSLAEIHPSLTGFLYDDDEVDAAVSSLDDCVRALQHGQVSWQFGAADRTAHEVTLYLERATAPAASLTLTCGIEPEDVGGLFAPNRLEIWIRRDAPSDLASPPVMHAILAAAAERWQADFGYVGTANLPPPAVPLVSTGEPPVGWMTFLSKRLPPPPATLKSPAVAYAAGSIGSVVVAHPKLYRDHVTEHRQAIAAVAQALAVAGVLRPSVREAQPPQ